MRKRAFLATLAAASIGLSPAGVSAQALPGDHLIVPGVRIGAAVLEQQDQGAMVRALGEPAQTLQRDDRAYYMYGAAPPDDAPAGDTSSDELMIELDLAKDAPFEISTTSSAYRTREGLHVGSAAAALRAALGAPLCEGGNAGGDGVIVYDTIWFRTGHGAVTRISIRNHLSAADFQTGLVHC